MPARLTLSLASLILGVTMAAHAAQNAPAPPPAPDPGSIGAPAAPPPPPKPERPGVPKRPGPQASVAAPAPIPPPGPPSVIFKNVNVRIDATVIESRGEQVINRRVVSATVADGQDGSVRSQIWVPTQDPRDPARRDMQRATMNMDVKARVRDDNHVQVWLTLEAQGGSLSLGDDKATDAGIRQSVSVLLVPGQPLVVAQSADAVGDRRLALEVKATVLK